MNYKNKLSFLIKKRKQEIFDKFLINKIEVEKFSEELFISNLVRTEITKKRQRYLY